MQSDHDEAAEQLAARLHAHGLTRVTDGLLPHALYAIACACRPVDEHDLALGISKVGGLPDLPRHVAWPEQHGRSMGFIMQTNLTEIASYDVHAMLPSGGLLSFFYLDPGEAPVDNGGCKVLYVDANPSDLVRCDAPESLASVSDSGFSVFPSCTLEFSLYGTLPDPSSLWIRDLLSEQEWRAYLDAYVGHPYEDDPAHWLLGYPYNLASNVLWQCYVESQERNAASWLHNLERLDVLNLVGGHGNRRLLERLEQESADWQHLLQVYSNDEAAMDWLGGGVLHFCIQKQALQARDFDTICGGVQTV